MKTSWRNVRWIELFLTNKLDENESLSFRKQRKMNLQLNQQIREQKSAYQLIQKIGRSLVRREIREIDQHFFHDPSQKEFQNNIHRIFS